jgi:tripartite-type tricarboxylate transporter receptor subunit TctC
MMRGFLRAMTCVLAVASAGNALAQFGSGNVRIVFPFAAGGNADAVARIIAERISRQTGKSAIVENITGASGHIGMRAVRDAKPDGGTLLFSPSSPMTLHEHFFGDRLTFDPFRDFAPVSQAVMFDYALAVNPNVPARNVKDFIAWLKADPSRASFATPGAGALGHFLGLELGQLWGMENRHVPYRGSPPAVNDLAAGHVTMAILNTTEFAQFHNDGKLRILGTFTNKPSPFVSNVPTMREQGVEIEAYGWHALYAPAKTPPDIIAALNRVVVETVQEPAMRERIFKMGLMATGTTPEELRAIQQRDKDFWGPIVKRSGFKPEL